MAKLKDFTSQMNTTLETLAKEVANVVRHLMCPFSNIGAVLVYLYPALTHFPLIDFLLSPPLSSILLTHSRFGLTKAWNLVYLYGEEMLKIESLP